MTTFYIGVTNNLERRVAEHKSGEGSIFTSKYNLDYLVYYEMITDIKTAIKREKQLNRKQTVDLLIFHESFDFISFPIFLPCNKKLQEHWVIKLNIQTIK
jgi:predicted GIY-YIG superfamily endonuclease